MTYEDWCKSSSAIIAEADKHNAWANKATHHLLTNIGPRIAKLGKSGYMGCGFHYSMEQSFGRLVDGLAIPWKPSANWCKKIEDDSTNAICKEACYRVLLDSVRKAERSVKKFKKMLTKAS
jgi:hypothetical protein